jgi:ABC-type enterochelin transport system permease subunit
MKKEAAKNLRTFAIELAVYAVLVTCYFFLVLHLLGEWLYHLETRHRYTYAVVAILLIAGQAVALDAVTTLLFRFLRRRWR